MSAYPRFTLRRVDVWLVVTAAALALGGCGTHSTASSGSAASAATSAPHTVLLDYFGHCSGWARAAGIRFVGHGGVLCGKR